MIEVLVGALLGYVVRDALQQHHDWLEWSSMYDPEDEEEDGGW